ncbi:MAG: STAS domain-containing protein [Rhodanobacter sp.]
MNTRSTPATFQLAQDTPDTLTLRGVLSFATAAQALQALQAALAKAAVTVLDLSGVTHGDSAGLSSLLAVMAEASARGRPVTLVHLPEGMQTLAGVCGVDRMLAE